MKFQTAKLPKFSFRFNFEKRRGSILKKLKEKKEELLMDNDLLFMLTYMASLSTAQLSRDKIFEMVAKKKEYVPSKYFKKIRDLTQKWHYDYATACNLIAEKVKHGRLKNLLNRLSNAIAAGEPDKEFLEKEWKTFKTVRKDEYKRALESLRKWTDAYVSIMVSASLISIVVLLSVIIYSLGNPAQIFLVAAIGNLVTCGFGVSMLFKAAPKDRKVHDFHIKSKEQRIILKLQLLLVPIAALLLIMLVITPTVFNLNSKLAGIDIRGLGMILAGIMLLPIAILGKKDDINISARDEVFTTFIRSLGAIKSDSGVPMVEALRRIDQKNLGALKDLVLQLYRRLSLGLNPKLCWERFTGESGSYLIHKLTGIFVDAIDLGGDANVVGEIVSSSNLEMVLLRLKRDLISSGFINLLIPLHISMVGLILFITQLMDIFTNNILMIFTTQLSGAGSITDVVSKLPGGLQGLNIGMFSSIPTGLLNQYAVALILSITLANSFAANIVKGSGSYMYVYFACIFMILSGLLLILVPPLVNWMFSLPSFVG